MKLMATLHALSVDREHRCRSLLCFIHALKAAIPKPNAMLAPFLLFGLYERKRFNRLLRFETKFYASSSFAVLAFFILWSGFNLFGGRKTAGSIDPGGIFCFATAIVRTVAIFIVATDIADPPLVIRGHP
jgi:hypothetical protein